MLRVAGLVFAALGVAAGVILVLSPFNLIPVPSGPSSWVLFPLFSAVGYLLFALPAGPATVRTLTRLMGVVFTLLAVMAAVGLFLTTTGFVKVSVGTLSQWYVLVVGLILGGAGLTAHAPAAPRSTPRIDS